jgi:hypothetical protein
LVLSSSAQPNPLGPSVNRPQEGLITRQTAVPDSSLHSDVEFSTLTRYRSE